MNRFELDEEWDGYFIDNSTKKDYCSDDMAEIVDLLNELNNLVKISTNELNRINFGLESLDIELGMLSLYAFEDSYTLKDIQDCSRKLSSIITDIMFPKYTVKEE